MGSSMAVSGLLTGFDAQSVVDKLMAVEKLAGNKISDAKTKASAVASAFTQLNGLVTKMGDAAKAVIPDPIAKTSIWQSASATSSDTKVATVTTSSGAQPSTLSFTVTQVAQAAASASGEITVADRNTALSTGTWSLDLGTGSGTSAKSTTLQFDATSTLNDVAAKINAQSDVGVGASVVQVADGTFRLQLTSKATGANSTITASATGTAPAGLTSFVETNAGQDTTITVGSKNPYTVTSPTTSVSGLMDGVTINAVATGTTTVTVAKDANAMADKIGAMVDAANAALTNIRINSKVDPNLAKAEAGKDSTNNSGLFLGNSTTSDLTRRISDVFVGSGSNIPSVAGMNIDKDGAVSFDKAKFLAAYAKDPAAVEKSVTDTAQKLADVSKGATNATDGTLTAAINGQNALVKDYTDQIKRFNDRMTAKQEMLTAQYNALDSMLSKLKSQGDWLAGQLNSLNGSSSSSK